jgi:hypothetical protein
MIQSRRTISCAVALLASVTPIQASAQQNASPISPTADRLFYGPCVVNARPGQDREAFPALLALAIPSLIKNGLSRFGQALRKSGEEKERSFTINRVFEDLPGESHPCIQFVRGRFYDEAPKDKNLFSFSGITTLPENNLRAAGIYLADEPDMMIEFERRQSKNGTAISYGVGFLSYQRTLFSRRDGSRNRGRGNKGDERFLAAQIIFHKPGVAADGQGAVGGEIAIGHAVSGQLPRKYPVIGGGAGEKGFEMETQWFPNFNAGGDSDGTGRIASNGENARLASYDKISWDQQASPLIRIQATGGPRSSTPSAGVKPRPFNLTLKIVEFQAENRFLTFLADVFDDIEEPLGDAFVAKTDPGQRAEARRQALQARNEALATFQTKFVAAETAVIDYCAGGGENNPDAKDWLLLSKEAYLAQLAANLEAQVLGVATPYPTPVAVGGNAPTCYKSR